MNDHVVEIVVGGQLHPELIAALDGFAIAPAGEGRTSVRGEIPDQAKLLGLIEMLEERHVDVVSVNFFPDDAA
jgi:hypothetical protein